MTVHALFPATAAPAAADPCPIAIGTPAVNPYGRVGYVIECSAPATVTYTIGASMTRDHWQLTIAYADSLSTVSENIAATWIDRARNLPHLVGDELALWAETAREREAESRAAGANAAADAQRRRDESAAELERVRPAWAVAAIVAELQIDESDSMTDYFHQSTRRRVVIGWSKHTRDLFAEMRNHAALFPETADLATAPASAEHREKYTGGKGYYLKATSYGDGWRVTKRPLSFMGGDVLEFALPVATGKPAPVGAETEARGDAAATGGGLAMTIEAHTHTKKGGPMWIVTAPRVERAEYDRLLTAARARGGWYSRAWGGTPAGFAFKVEAQALAFMADEAGSPAPVGDNTEALAPVTAPPVPARPAQPAATKATGAAKLRAIADGLQSLVDDRFRDRLANTPKRARQAGEARNEGVELERAQRMIRALADAHDAGAVPPCLASVKTKAELLHLAKEEVEHKGGYYDAGRPQGRPYDWARSCSTDGKAKAEQAAALWGLLAAPVDPARAADEDLRRKLEALRFANIPGYFPTPAAVVAQMIDAAGDLSGCSVLEPSAGSGAIADALREAVGPKGIVHCVERHASLCDILQLKGHRLHQGDIMETGHIARPNSPVYYVDAVVMNPPFERGQDIDHVRHCARYVKSGGRLVAIMSAGVLFRSDRKTVEFREWAEERGGEFVEIPAGAFKESGTGVATVMLTLCF